MKKMFLGLSLAVAALGFLMSPAMAAPVLSVSDQAFLASLAAPVPAAKRPHIALKDTCTANCAGGGTVTCSGGGSCTAVDGNCSVGEPGHVVCGGVTTSCPACPADCDELFSNCELSCDPCPIKFFQCSPYRCRCDFLHCGF